MEPTTKLRKIRKDINGKTINKSNVVQRFQKYLTKKVLEIFNRDPVTLNPWDPMGSLAH